MKFNDKLNQYMTMINCTSKELSKSSSLSASIISRYKNGSRTPSYNNLKAISLALEKLSDYKYNSEDILKDFYQSTNEVNEANVDFEIVKNNINEIINTFNINVSVLAKFLNFDASYLSKIRAGNRVPANKEKFIDSFSDFILKKYNSIEDKNTLALLINCKVEELCIEKIKYWISNNKASNSKEIGNFLKKLDGFNLNDYIKAIKFDKLKVPTFAFYKCKTKNYYGLEEMKEAELNFFKATVLSKSRDDIFMCSDMPMEDMAKDIEFGKKWMFAIAMSLKKGLHLNIIHNLERPFNEMMLGLESWIPIYMTGQISPYYLSNNKNSMYNHLNYVSGACALTGECIVDNHGSGKYYLTSNTKEIKYYKEKSELLLKKANSLMDIYRIENADKYKIFLSNDVNIKEDRTIINSSLPIFTIENKLLIKILKRNNLSQNDIENILAYKENEEENIKTVLKENKINEIIHKFNKDEVENDEVYLSLENMFYEKKIKYNYDEYIEHYNSTLKYNYNANYSVDVKDNNTFKNITINIIGKKYIILSKSCNPIIHFVIRHPKLVSAITNFEPLVKEE